MMLTQGKARKAGQKIISFCSGRQLDVGLSQLLLFIPRNSHLLQRVRSLHLPQPTGEQESFRIHFSFIWKTRLVFQPKERDLCPLHELCVLISVLIPPALSSGTFCGLFWAVYFDRFVAVHVPVGEVNGPPFTGWGGTGIKCTLCCRISLSVRRLIPCSHHLTVVSFIRCNIWIQCESQ